MRTTPKRNHHRAPLRLLLPWVLAIVLLVGGVACLRIAMTMAAGAGYAPVVNLEADTPNGIKLPAIPNAIVGGAVTCESVRR